MSKVINTESPAVRRQKILRLIAIIVNQLGSVEQTRSEINDQIAFIYLSLIEIEKTIKATLKPWEKRDYWVKADKFRAEWLWVGEIRRSLKIRQLDSGWLSIPDEIASLAKKLTGVEPIKRFKNEKFWIGAYQRMISVNSS